MCFSTKALVKMNNKRLFQTPLLEESVVVVDEHAANTVVGRFLLEIFDSD